MTRSETVLGRPPLRPGPSQQRVAEGVVNPLSGPSYGAYSVAKRRWRKPLHAIITDALINSQAVLSRLDRGMYMPEENSHYRQAFNQLYR